MTETSPDIQAQPHATPQDARPIDPTEGKTVAEIFGEIVWLMTQDQNCRPMQIGSLEALVMPAILLKQFHITYAPVNTGKAEAGALQPCKAELFAMVSDLLAAQLDKGLTAKDGLTMPEWRSGPHRRTVLTVSLPGVP